MIDVFNSRSQVDRIFLILVLVKEQTHCKVATVQLAPGPVCVQKHRRKKGEKENGLES